MGWRCCCSAILLMTRLVVPLLRSVGRAGLVKLLWHDGVGLYLLTKRLERGGFAWPQTVATLVTLSPGQLATLLVGCEWRAPVRSLRPELAG